MKVGDYSPFIPFSKLKKISGLCIHFLSLSLNDQSAIDFHTTGFQILKSYFHTCYLKYQIRSTNKKQSK